MQAAIHVPNSPILKIENNFEIPKPGPDQVLIQVQASGICHSDVSYPPLFFKLIITHTFLWYTGFHSESIPG